MRKIYIRSKFWEIHYEYPKALIIYNHWKYPWVMLQPDSLMTLNMKNEIKFFKL